MMNQAQKEKFWQIIFKADTREGKLFDLLLLIAILISILAVILESIESLNSQFHLFLQIAEWLITAVFTLEYLFRIYVVRSKRRYIFSFYGIIAVPTGIVTALVIQEHKDKSSFTCPECGEKNI